MTASVPSTDAVPSAEAAVSKSSIPIKELPLRDVLNSLEHRIRELMEHLNLDVSQSCDEMHQLTRPKRRKSVYPTIRNLSNGYEKYAHALRYADRMVEGIEEGLAVLESRLEELN
jgi:hypothetical protein